MTAAAKIYEEELSSWWRRSLTRLSTNGEDSCPRKDSVSRWEDINRSRREVNRFMDVIYGLMTCSALHQDNIIGTEWRNKETRLLAIAAMIKGEINNSYPFTCLCICFCHRVFWCLFYGSMSDTYLQASNLIMNILSKMTIVKYSLKDLFWAWFNLYKYTFCQVDRRQDVNICKL